MTTPQNHTPDPLSPNTPARAYPLEAEQALEAWIAEGVWVSPAGWWYAAWMHRQVEVARLQAENTAMRDVLALGRQVMDGLMAGSNNDYSVWEGKSISDRWFELRDEFRARLNDAGVTPAQSEQKVSSP